VNGYQFGVDLAQVRGTGRRGLITRKDVKDADAIRRLKEKAAEAGAPLRPGSIIEQTRQALEEAGAAPPAAPPRKPPSPPEAPPAAPEPEGAPEGEEVPMHIRAKEAPPPRRPRGC